MKAISVEKYEAKKKAHQMATDMLMDKWREFCSKMDVSILYTLHFYFDFDKEKLLEFYRT